MFKRFGTYAFNFMAVCMLCCMAAVAHAQDPPDPDPDPPPEPLGGDLSGVMIDANGVLKMQLTRDPGLRLLRQKMVQAHNALPKELRRPSKLRKISLKQLEAAVAEAKATNGGIPDEMACLAGLTRIQYVFYMPETNDIVIAGPAEGFFRDLHNRPVGMTTGRSVLELQDLVTALRTFKPGGNDNTVIGCSIDPTKEGLKRMQNFLRNIGGRAVPSQTAFIVQGLQKSLGMQKVTVMGISPKTHFAQILVEADYRMKLIGIGLERPAVKIDSYVSKANPAAVSRNAMQRWWFMPNYDSVRVSEDQTAMELVGNGVKLANANELVTNDGNRVKSGAVDRASKTFVTSFTKKYGELADATPVYAQLRNVIDMSIVAAYLQKYDYYGKANWRMSFFGDEKQFPVETQNAPMTVRTAVNAIWKRSTLMTPIGGGVRIEAKTALSSENTLSDEGGALAKTHKEIEVKPLEKGQWWWD